ncbi:Myxococcus xanthus paralogous domain TIGR02266 [Malonomonas rubra DSM 5091]|uniref:Myxococcus xanthus paralogous domain TIGR02266 n=1 Tax=Malonomonas rubra DSM 5091 TaxID=1122189 RepID=A0A1M6CKW2_MALRU|nr:TIGR02266 family protein [Malonomonas rubra]SHI61662.1 Myxococcus xanthus paralogous domain TIGR02266 [Malonomonas rubra DSM 5091]
MKTVSENRSILLVDDVELFLELERTFFHREGFDLLVAVNPQEIMQLVLKRRPDLVFMDTEVAEKRGDEICRWMKQDDSLCRIPVIMVVDSGDSVTESLCRQAGCDAVIHRPVRRQQLLSAARTFLELADRQMGRVDARLQVEFSHDTQRGTNYTVNLSPGGLFLATDAILPVDTPLSLKVKFPSAGTSLTCRGRVAWLNRSEQGRKQPHLPSGIGIEFSGLDHEQRGVVERYLAGAA